jgi:5-methylthioadenosine/S-adenosylhomocysteine deaminase
MLFRKITVIDDEFRAREDMYVGVEGREITYVGKEAPDDVDRFGEQYDGKGKVLMPGFYNAHGHSPMSLMRGYGENLPLDRWLNELIFPFEAKLDGEAVYWATLLTMAESARFGIVSTTDMYMYVDDMVRAVEESGEKVNICRSVTNIPGDSPDKNPLIGLMTDCIKKYGGYAGGRVKADASVHAEYTNDDATIDAVAAIAKEYGVNMHVHVAETRGETEGCRERHGGLSPVQYLASHGLFDTKTTAAHCVWLTDEDRKILSDKNVTVASNPVSNLKLCSGICCVPALYDAGVEVAIGTDSVSSNNSLDFFEEMKTFALLGKISSGDPSRMRPDEVLYSATRAGALAQGRDDCGLIREGFRADLIVVDTDVPNMQPVHDIANNLVYSASGKDVAMTMVDGTVVYRDGEYPTIDVEKAAAETSAAKNRILGRL